MKHILLVDDDSRDVELTLAALEESHLANKVTVAKNGEMALDYLYRRGKFEKRDDGHPIVVLLEFRMAKIDGLEMLKIMKADDNLQGIPVVLLTSSAEAQDLIHFNESGLNAYLRKPLVLPSSCRPSDKSASSGRPSNNRLASARVCQGIPVGGG